MTRQIEVQIRSCTQPIYCTEKGLLSLNRKLDTVTKCMELIMDISQTLTALHTVHCTQCSALHTVHCTLHTAHCTLHTAHCTLYTVHCTVYSVHCTLHTVHFTLYIENCMHTTNWTILVKADTFTKTPDSKLLFLTFSCRWVLRGWPTNIRAHVTSLAHMFIMIFLTGLGHIDQFACV